jgi:glycosyltransferase involved in cell wall biosynthesis
MVTGAYYPEISGAGLQCRALVNKLRGRVGFTVLTTTADRSLPAEDIRDGVPVYRVFIDPLSWWSKARGTLRFTMLFLRIQDRFSIVHFHGFSQKSILLMWLARLKRKRIAIKLTSMGHDDPASMMRRGGFTYWCYAHSDLFFAVSPRFEKSYEVAGLSPARFRLIPNGVDCDRFRPASSEEREALRRELGLQPGTAIVLFVGFFSQEKRPDLLFEAWANLTRTPSNTALVFIGATQSPYYEVDEELVKRIREMTITLGVESRVRFVEATHEIERFHRAADVFVLPSLREGMPNALLEAMASGTACIATRLEGITDAIIDDGQNGLLVPANDRPALQNALQRCLDDPHFARSLGAHARRTAEDRFGLEGTARQYFDAYSELKVGPECAA